MVAMYFPLWSYIVVSEVFVWMVGLLDMMSLSGLHSWMEVVRLVMFSGGWMNFISLVWTWVR